MRRDILLDENDDLNIAGGDIVTGASAEQECYILTIVHPGELRQYPAMGFGLDSRIKKRTGTQQNVPIIENRQKFIRDLKAVLLADGQNNPEVNINDTLTDFEIFVDP